MLSGPLILSVGLVLLLIGTPSGILGNVRYRSMEGLDLARRNGNPINPILLQFDRLTE